MDGDPGVEPTLDAFSQILPLPYRVAIILVTGNMHAHPDNEGLTKLSRCLGLGSEPSIFTCRSNCTACNPLSNGLD
jgi:hypothetical protein